MVNLSTKKLCVQSIIDDSARLLALGTKHDIEYLLSVHNEVKQEWEEKMSRPVLKILQILMDELNTL